MAELGPGSDGSCPSIWGNRRALMAGRAKGDAGHEKGLLTDGFPTVLWASCLSVVNGGQCSLKEKPLRHGASRGRRLSDVSAELYP